MGADEDPAIIPCRLHFDAEKEPKLSGIAWTMWPTDLRGERQVVRAQRLNRARPQLAPQELPHVRLRQHVDELYIPGAGPIIWLYLHRATQGEL